jgi:hypothetical protein
VWITLYLVCVLSQTKSVVKVAVEKSTSFALVYVADNQSKACGGVISRGKTLPDYGKQFSAKSRLLYHAEIMLLGLKTLNYCKRIVPGL